jgi:hypothetical protein
MVGGADNDGVHVFAGQDLPVIAGNENVFAVHLPRPRQPPVVQIASCDHFYAGIAQGRIHIVEPLNTHADAGEVDLVVGGKSPEWPAKCLRFSLLGDQQGNGEKGGELTEEFSSCGHDST